LAAHVPGFIRSELVEAQCPGFLRLHLGILINTALQEAPDNIFELKTAIHSITAYDYGFSELLHDS